MYRNICYKMDTNNRWKGNIVLFTWDSNGNRIKKEISHESYLYYEDSLGKDYSIYNTKIKKKLFPNTINRKKWIEENKDVNIYECLYPTLEYLQSEYYNKNKDIKEFTKYQLRTCFIDIEIAIESEFPTAKEANYPINIISFYDNFTNKKYSYILGDAYIDDTNVVIYKFTNEIELLRKFLIDFKQFEFDIITGWNIICFDIVYIYYRLKKLFGDEVANSISPINNVRADKIHLHGDPMEYDRLIIDGISQLDYYLLYKHFVTPVEGLKSSYTLDYIGREEIGEGKISYEGDLKRLYKTNFQKFVEYNLQDVDLVVKIDKKRKFINLTRHLCNISLIEYEKIFVSSAPVVGSVLQLSKNLGVHLPYVRQDNKEEGRELIGAFVKEPEVKAYRNGVAAFDIQSLYPNIMISFNISPETLLGKIYEYENDTILKTNKQDIKLTKPELEKLKNNNNYCIAANGSVYTTKKKGIIPIFLEEFFSARLKLKNDAKKIKREINKLKNEEIKDEKLIKQLEEELDNIDLEQITRKIILNTTYGVCGSKHSIFYNINNGEAVTLSGQKIIKASGDFIDNYIKNKFNINESKSYIIYSDTDSVASKSTIRTNIGILKIEDLYKICELQKENKKSLTNSGHERIEINSELKTFCYSDKLKLVNIKNIFKHKVRKRKYKIVVGNKEVIVTEDHSCIVIRDGKQISIKAADILKTDKLMILS